MKHTSFKLLRARFAAFAGDTRGSVNIEGMLFFPLLLMFIAATIVFYDAFRRDSLSQKAAYTVGDMLSRETAAINGTYIDNARKLLALMSDVPESDVSIRVTQVVYNKRYDEYRVNWSKERGNHSTRLRTVDTRNMHEELPNMVGAERLIIVDTFVNYEWPIDLGFDDHVFESTVFTRPRFAPKLVWSNGS
ncbi:TadE/TadG family type IV pilus assembly protein [Primorskyibacter sp. S187A]|uniref:TadE/TadG family type IV pilus assembly protein n=1 Tax=Primorskyibacter sp. S187A TaxID=3415130 RepID=UPI003C7D1310